VREAREHDARQLKCSCRTKPQLNGWGFLFSSDSNQGGVLTLLRKASYVRVGARGGPSLLDVVTCSPRSMVANRRTPLGAFLFPSDRVILDALHS
jgi:hypothetical protein